MANSEGNHGEDAKEYYFYLDSTPTHSYMKNIRRRPIPIQIWWRPNRRRVGKSDQAGFQQRVKRVSDRLRELQFELPEKREFGNSLGPLPPRLGQVTENPTRTKPLARRTLPERGAASRGS